MKPAVAGMPARPSIAIVIGHASSGCARPRPSSERRSSPCSDTRSRATTTANAATFMNRYTAR
jgi:hypothetical protein